MPTLQVLNTKFGLQCHYVWTSNSYFSSHVALIVKSWNAVQLFEHLNQNMTRHDMALIDFCECIDLLVYFSVY